MLIKTGDAEIIGIVNPSEVDDDELRKSALSTALDKAKERISTKKPSETKAMEN